MEELEEMVCIICLCKIIAGRVVFNPMQVTINELHSENRVTIIG